MFYAQLIYRSVLKATIFIGCFVLMSFLIPYKADAAIINVSSIPALQSAINSAAPGDVIVLADNIYLNNTINISTSNITVRAATPGGVILNGSNSITISGNNVSFSGFQFTSGSISGMVITVTGNYVLLTQLNFNGYSAQKYINLQGQYDEVSYCNFENKPTSAPQGNLIHIAPNGSVPNYAKIRYCSFKNMPGAGGDNGNECIRIANGAQSTYLCRTIVEFCYFENTGDGDSEAISVKSRENTLRFNTFRNNQNAMMVFRNGNDNVAYGNFFIAAGGIRVKEANNIFCYNNYFENAGVGGTMNAVSYVYVSPNLKNINFLHNTFVECGLIDLSSGATNNTWANNIFKKSSGNIFTGSSSGIAWAGNIYHGSLGISIPSEMTNTDPLLAMNSENYYGLSSSSPAINNSSSSYPAILDIANIDDDPSLSFDISGQSRPVGKTEKDAGSDEYTTGNTTNHPLVLSEVGPSYLGGPGGATKQDQTITFTSLPSKVYGDADFNPGATASSGLPVSYTSSNTAVATIVNGNIHITGAGSSSITAKQAGNANYNAAPDISQTLTVAKANQSITFNPLPNKNAGDADFNPGATASSGLPASYTSSNTAVATIVNGNIHIVGAGTSIITASQAGNTNYNAATDVIQTLTVTVPVVYNFAPTSTTILSGTLNSGTYGNLATNNSSYYVVRSTTSGTRKTDWYGSTTISQPTSSVTKLTINYDGRNSANKTQVLYLYNWVTGSWTQIESRNVSTSDVLITNSQTAPANYISTSGEIRLRVFSSGGNKNYTTSGDWLQFTIETSNTAKTMAAPSITVLEMKRPEFGIYPNPASKNILVQYRLNKEENVQLAIFNLNGQLVRQLMINQKQNQGDYNKSFVVSDLTDGVYIVRFSAGNLNKSIKIVVLK
jgi:hypothetical protein